MEQAKSADGYLPKCRSNHFPTTSFFVAKLCCHPVANMTITTTTLLQKGFIDTIESILKGKLKQEERQ